MSYILDALRRADAERQRGGVPDLHAQPAASATPGHAGASTEGSGLGGRGVLVAGSVGLVVLAGAAAWWLGRGSLSEPVSPPQAPAPLAALPSPGAPGLQTAPVTAPATGPAAPASPTRAADLPTAAPAVLPPSTAAPLAVGPAPALATASPMAPAPAAAPLRAAAVASAAAASAPDPVVRLVALPEAIRNTLPTLSWSGGVYADQPAQRLVVVNGQVAREGDELAPGLRLEQIRPKTVVVRWRGQRIELPI